MRPGPRVATFGTNVFTEMTRLANEHGAVNLAQGFPDFDGPEFVKEAAKRAIDAGQNQYAPMAGLPALTSRVAREVAARTGVARDPASEVLVGCGATELLFDAVLALTAPGDEVVLLEPFYDSYLAAVRLAGATPRVARLSPPGFELTKEALSAAVSERTRLIVVNQPHNPSGRVFTRDELELVASEARLRDVACLSDEVYDRLVYARPHLSISSLAGMADRTLVFGSLSKTYSLTGWRVGWVTGPRELIAATRAAHQFVTFTVPAPLQHGAAAALDAPASYYEQLVAEYRARRDLLIDALALAGLEPFACDGAYFVCAGFSRFAFDDDVAFARFLTTEIGVAAIPPSAFHLTPGAGRSYVRFTFAKQLATLERARDRLRALAGVATRG